MAYLGTNDPVLIDMVTLSKSLVDVAKADYSLRTDITLYVIMQLRCTFFHGREGICGFT